MLIGDEGPSKGKLIETLRLGGALIEQVGTGLGALETLRRREFDLVLLNLNLPDMEGREVLRRMRAARVDTQTVVLSMRVRPQVRAKAFALGADDVVTEPFDVNECHERIRALARSGRRSTRSVLKVGNLHLDIESRSVTVGERSVHLTSKEYAILELLVLRRGMILTQGVLLNRLYGGMDEPEVRIVDVFVCKLRKKLAEAGAADTIATVWGRGYTVRDRERAESENEAGLLLRGRDRDEKLKAVS